MSKSDYVKTKIGSGVMKLKIASQMVISSPVQKKSFGVVPKKKTASVAQAKEEKIIPQESLSESRASGSEFGTSSQGRTDILSTYTAELRAMIDKNKYYPPLSRRLGQAGTVVVAFTLLEDGNIIDVRVDKPSRYARLNDSAVDAVKKVERFKPIPKELGEVRMDIKVPVKFFTI